MAIEKINRQLPFKPPLLVVSINNTTSWDEWLSETEAKLKELGYRKYGQRHVNEDFCYWKVFKDGENKIYQIGISFHDFREFANHDPDANRIGIMYDCMLLCGDRIGMRVSKNIDLNKFESMAKTFYEAMAQYCIK
jgi:hypothetical protein